VIIGTIANTRQLLRIVWLLAIVLLTVGAAYRIHQVQPSYQESATVLFALPGPQPYTDPYLPVSPTLITTGEAITQILMSPQAQNQVSNAGGDAVSNLALINFYNQDYPEYSYPEATLTASSADPRVAHRAFLLAARRIAGILASRQEQVGVPPGGRIVSRLIADTGPLAQHNSRKRAFGGLALLAFVIGASGWSAIGRWHFSGSGKHSLAAA
jgi:hypothetical protein